MMAENENEDKVKLCPFCGSRRITSIASNLYKCSRCERTIKINIFSLGGGRPESIILRHPLQSRRDSRILKIGKDCLRNKQQSKMRNGRK